MHERPISVLHWNILASYMGRNALPWFLHGIHLDAARRKAIVAKYEARDPVTHLPLNPYPRFLEGMLSASERATVACFDEKYFAWPTRFERLTSRILEVNADVLSLVELDRFEDFKKRLGHVYDGVFMRRPRPVSPDGSSLFWRKDVFKLVRHSAVTFVDRYNPVAVQDRCAVVALLERAEGDRTLFVSVHLAREKVGEPQGYLRSRQLALLAQSLRECCSQWGEGAEDTPVVMCGDVNEPALPRLQGMAAVGAILAGSPLHPFVFSSKAAALRHPTSVTEARRTTVDAVLYSHSALHVTAAVLDGGAPGPIPDSRTPSDHHAVLCSVRAKSPLARTLDSVALWLDAVHGRAAVEDDLFLGPSDLALAFAALDIDADGVASHLDAVVGLAALGLPRPPDALFPLTYAHFCAVFYQSRPFSNLLARAAFDSIDSSPHDGRVSQSELELFFHAFDSSPLEVKKAQCLKLLAEARANGLASGDGLDLDGFQTFLGAKFCELVFDAPVAKEIVDHMLKYRHVKLL